MQNATERRQEILYFISDRRRVKYREIANEFNISYNTARNDGKRQIKRRMDLAKPLSDNSVEDYRELSIILDTFHFCEGAD